MANGLQDVKLTAINASTHPKDRQQAPKLEGRNHYKQFATAVLVLVWAVISIALK